MRLVEPIEIDQVLIVQVDINAVGDGAYSIRATLGHVWVKADGGRWSAKEQYLHENRRKGINTKREIPRELWPAILEQHARQRIRVAEMSEERALAERGAAESLDAAAARLREEFEVTNG